MGSNVVTAVAIFLPLSSLWAAASVDSQFQASKEKNYGKNNMFVSGASASTGPSAYPKKNIGGPRSPADPATTARLSGSTSSSPQAMNGVFKDLEAQDLVEMGHAKSEM